MIVAHFDQGWDGVRAAELQHRIVDAYVKPLQQLQHSAERVVLVNNTWYYTDFDEQGNFIKNPGTAFEQTIQHFLDNNQVDIIVEYSLVDPAWNTPVYNTNARVLKIGYYNSEHWIDFHALVVNEFMYIDSDLAADASRITVPFMSLNGKPADHRTRLVQALVDRNLHTQGVVTYGGTPTLTIQERDTRVHGVNSDPFDAMSLGDIDNWNKHFLNIVSETIWDVENFAFWSEKIFKPIIGMRPFLVNTPNGATLMLEQHGFRHFCDSFTDITDLDLRDPANLPAFLEILCNQPVEYYQQKYLELLPDINYNRARFDQHVQEQWEKINNGIQ